MTAPPVLDVVDVVPGMEGKEVFVDRQSPVRQVVASLHRPGEPRDRAKRGNDRRGESAMAIARVSDQFGMSPVRRGKYLGAAMCSRNGLSTTNPGFGSAGGRGDGQ